MSRQNINNLESGLDVRNAINANFIELYSVTASTAGLVTSTSFRVYTGATATALSNKLDNSFATAVSSSLSNKVDNSTYNAFTSANATALAGKLSTSTVYLSGSTNLGTGAVILGSISNHNIQAKSLVAGQNILLTSTSTGITITSSGGTQLVSGATNLGSGNGLFTSLASKKLQFKSLVAGANITLSPTSTGITISSSAASVTFPTLSGTSSGVTIVNSAGTLKRASIGAGLVLNGDGSLGTAVTLINITGSTTLNATHNGKTIQASNTITLTLPNGMIGGYNVNVVNVGTGVITMAASTTLNTKLSNKKLATQYGAGQFYHQGSNIYIGFGDLTA